jgi:hypothetical protein
MVVTGLMFAIVALVFMRPAEKPGDSIFNELLGMRLDSDEMIAAQSLIQVLNIIFYSYMLVLLPFSRMYFLAALSCLPQTTGIETMLSTKGKVCGNKDYMLQKMLELRDKLVAFEQEIRKQVDKRAEQESSAKTAWLDEEGQYALQTAALDQAKLNLAADLKKVTSRQDLLALSKARLAKVKAATTDQLSEIDEEEAIIRELLGYISDLTKSTVDVVRQSPARAPECPSSRHPLQISSRPNADAVNLPLLSS